MVTRRPLIPKVRILKNDNVTYYYFDPFSAVYDFRVRNLRCSPAFDAQGGDFDITLASSDGTNSAANTFLNNIQEGNEVLISIGKPLVGATDIFLGVIETIEIDEPNKNYMEIKLSGNDWGSSLLKHRVINNAINQFTMDGTTLDDTDNRVLIENIVQVILGYNPITAATDRSWYPQADVTAIDQGLVVSTNNIASTGTKLAQFYANFEFLDDKLSELDALAGTIHYVDVNKNFVLKYPGDNTTTPASILLTDDINDSVSSSFSSDKIGYIAPNSVYIKSLEHTNRRLFGIGGDQPLTDIANTTNTGSDATYSGGSVRWLGVQFQPTKLSLETIELYLSKTGSPTSDVVCTLIEDFNNAPAGSTLARVTKPASAVNSSPAWHPYSFHTDMNTAKKYWVIVEGNGDASNYFNWYHDSSATNLRATSTDGVTWSNTSSSYTYCFRTNILQPLTHTYPGVGATAADKHFYEDVIKKPDITHYETLYKMLVVEGQTALKRKEIFRGKIYAPDTLLQTGQGVRIRKQQSGFLVDADFVIGKIDYTFEATDDAATGTFYYEIEAARFSQFLF